MAYAGLCDDDNLQPQSDPYFSQQSQTQIYAWVDAPGDSRESPPLSSVQRVSLEDFNGVDSFDISFDGGAARDDHQRRELHADGIKAAIDAAIGANKTVTVTNWENQDGGALDQNGFTVTYDSDVDEPALGGFQLQRRRERLRGRRGRRRHAQERRHADGDGQQGADGPDRGRVHDPRADAVHPDGDGLRSPIPRDTLTYLWEESDAGNGQALGTEPGATWSAVPRLRRGPAHRHRRGLQLDAEERDDHQPGSRLPRRRPGHGGQHRRGQGLRAPWPPPRATTAGRSTCPRSTGP